MGGRDSLSGRSDLPEDIVRDHAGNGGVVLLQADVIVADEGLESINHLLVVSLARLIGLLLGLEHLDQGGLALFELGAFLLDSGGAGDDVVGYGNVLVCHNNFPPYGAGSW